MDGESDEAEDRGHVSPGLVSSAVLVVMLLIASSFLSQLPDTPSPRHRTAAAD